MVPQYAKQPTSRGLDLHATGAHGLSLLSGSAVPVASTVGDEDCGGLSAEEARLCGCNMTTPRPQICRVGSYHEKFPSSTLFCFPFTLSFPELMGQEKSKLCLSPRWYTKCKGPELRK